MMPSHVGASGCSFGARPAIGSVTRVTLWLLAFVLMADLASETLNQKPTEGASGWKHLNGIGSSTPRGVSSYGAGLGPLPGTGVTLSFNSRRYRASMCLV